MVEKNGFTDSNLNRFKSSTNKHIKSNGLNMEIKKKLFNLGSTVQNVKVQSNMQRKTLIFRPISVFVN